ncbi:hypothetical protein [Corynebacterium sp. 335C]
MLHLLDQIAPILTPIVAVVAAWAAIAKIQEMRKEYRATNRPVMAAYYERPVDPLQSLEVRIANVGAKSAHDVRITFDPPLPTLDPDVIEANSAPGIGRPEASLADIVKRILVDKTFSTWPPGFSTVHALYTPHRDGIDSTVSAEGVPVDQRIALEYRDGKGQRYRDEFELNALLLHGQLFLKSDVDKLSDEVRRVHRTLETIAERLDRLERDARDDVHRPGPSPTA